MNPAGISGRNRNTNPGTGRQMHSALISDIFVCRFVADVGAIIRRSWLASHRGSPKIPQRLTSVELVVTNFAPLRMGSRVSAGAMVFGRRSCLTP